MDFGADEAWRDGRLLSAACSSPDLDGPIQQQAGKPSIFLFFSILC
jgi:hypothetical protein